jgi:hypothetical protein
LEPYAPFLIATLVVGALVVVEIVGAIFGFSGLVGHGDADIGAGPADAAPSDAPSSPLDWLNRGRVPLTVLLMLFLGLFAAIGFAVQAVADAIAAPLPALGAGAIAAGAALIATGEASRLVGRILPRDESYAAHADDLIGRTGVVTLGPLGGALVGRARVADGAGNVHFPLVRPLSPEEPIPEGAEVELVSREGREFFVVRKAPDASRGIVLDRPPAEE